MEMEKIVVPVRRQNFAVWRRPGRNACVVFVHGTGFHGRVWDSVIEYLPGYDCIAIDMRGHGASDKPDPPYEWTEFGLDVKAILHALDISADIGVGHSMGGHSLALASALAPHRFKSLLLIDPIIFKEESYGDPKTEPHAIIKRRNQWVSKEKMFESFSARKPFATWHSQALKDYCQYGLVPDATGDGYVLACPPDVEASIYNQAVASSANIYAELKKIEVPVHLLRPKLLGDPKKPNLVQKDLLKYFQNGHETLMPDQTHFIPMEVPEKVAEIIRTTISEQSR
jgi:pimeloyl-ACP methyl ester carboxylesterase